MIKITFLIKVTILTIALWKLSIICKYLTMFMPTLKLFKRVKEKWIFFEVHYKLFDKNIIILTIPIYIYNNNGSTLFIQ